MTRDPIDEVFSRADWWTHLALAEAWAATARLFEATDPGAARLAWKHAAASYGVYSDEYRAHLPTSRWDNDYGPELAEAETKWRALADQPMGDATPVWVRAALERRFAEAIANVRDRPTAAAERALLAMLAIACHWANRKEDAQRLETWSKAVPSHEQH